MVKQRNTLLVVLGLAGLFLCGALTGVFAVGGMLHHHLRGLHSHGPNGAHTLGVKWLDWELDLDAEQERELEQILDEAHIDLFRFKSEHNEEITAILEPSLERIDALLTPEQAERWAPMRARVVEHLEARME